MWFIDGSVASNETPSRAVDSHYCCSWMKRDSDQKHIATLTSLFKDKDQFESFCSNVVEGRFESLEKVLWLGSRWPFRDDGSGQQSATPYAGLQHGDLVAAARALQEAKHDFCIQSMVGLDGAESCLGGPVVVPCSYIACDSKELRSRRYTPSDMVHTFNEDTNVLVFKGCDHFVSVDDQSFSVDATYMCQRVEIAGRRNFHFLWLCMIAEVSFI